MGLRAPVGAGNKLEIFPIGANGEFSATRTFVFDKNVTFNISGHPKKNSMIIEMDSKIDDEAYGEFLKSYLGSASVETQEIEYVDSDKDILISGIDRNTPFGYVWYGAKDVNNRIKVIVGRGILTGDSGNASYQAKNVGNYPVQITTVPDSPVYCPSACLDSSRIQTPTDISITSAEYGCIRFFTAKS